MSGLRSRRLAISGADAEVPATNPTPAVARTSGESHLPEATRVRCTALERAFSHCQQPRDS